MGLISRVSSRTYRKYRKKVLGHDGIDKPDGKTKQALLNQMSEAQKSQRKVLIRAKTNKKKLATIIEKEKLGEFQTEYCKMLRSSMDGLKKKVKKKKIVQQPGQQAKKAKN